MVILNVVTLLRVVAGRGRGASSRTAPTMTPSNRGAPEWAAASLTGAGTQEFEEGTIGLVGALITARLGGVTKEHVFLGGDKLEEKREEEGGGRNQLTACSRSCREMSVNDCLCRPMTCAN